jgi:hypothetical protein
MADTLPGIAIRKAASARPSIARSQSEYDRSRRALHRLAGRADVACHRTAPPHSGTGPLRQTRLQASTCVTRPVSFAAAFRPTAEPANGRAWAVAVARPSASTPAVVILANRVTVSSFVSSAETAEHGLRRCAGPPALMQINGVRGPIAAVPRGRAEHAVQVHGACDAHHREFHESRLMCRKSIRS